MLHGGYLLGVDPALACGFAVVREDGSHVQSGTWRLQTRAHQGHGGRFCNLVAHLDSIVSTFPSIVSVAYEVPGHLRVNGGMASPATYLGLYGLVAHVESWAESRELHYSGVTPQAVKMACGAPGNAKKADVLACVERRFGLTFSANDHNEADALGVALAGLRLLRTQQDRIA